MGSLIRDTGAPYVRRSHLDSATCGSQQIGLGGRLKQKLTGGERTCLFYGMKTLIHQYVMVHLHNWLLCIITGFYT